ncbi:YihY/virulence factor BrkB family protein [Longitalea arenae]|uniref:YihY/virulence factor BrkB family protein n=1 Tax=Longitalea arenae TaxID=2812558 RepID=UPI0019670440|nr:YihY/virulence factor BrkB family protein [Longitalea arenae]
MKAFSARGIGTLLKDSFKSFSEDKIPKLGGSLAYFTIFSLGPMLLVIIFLAGLFLGQKAVEGSLYEQINQMVGPTAAEQVQQLIKSAAASGGGIVAIIGIVTLLIGATSVFTEIQDSINTIWHLRMKPNNSWKTLLKSRLLSFGLIAGIGFLLLVSLAASALMEGLGKKISELIPGIGVWLMVLVSYAFTLFLAVFLFAIIFKVLPAAYISWREVWPGALATALLFIIGRFLISFYISKSDLGSTYGAAGSLVVLLVWVYYSSLILYFGAEFTRAYVGRFGAGIRPKPFAFVAEEQTAANKKNVQSREY